MSSSLGCPRCGYQNPAGYQFCTNCGAPLTGSPAGVPASGTTVSAAAPGAVYVTPPMSYDWPRQVDRTKTGVLLLLFGSLLSWVPYGVAVLGDVLLLVGAILVILGRKAFGPAHSRNVVISIVVFCIGIVTVIGVAIVAILPSLPSIINAGGVMTPAVRAGVQNAGLEGAIAAAVVIGIAEVQFIYALQVPRGRLLLWAGYAANLAVAVAIYVVLNPIYNAVVTQADFDSALRLQVSYSIFSAIPALLFAAADYLAWSRINRREIPPAPVPPTPPTYVPPATFTASAPSAPKPVSPPSEHAPPLNPK